MGDIIPFGKNKYERAERKRMFEKHPLVSWLDSFIHSPQAQKMLEKPTQIQITENKRES